MLLWDNSSFLGPGPNEQPIERSQLVHSGNGLHAYWFLDTPADAQSEQKRLERLLKTLAHQVGGDQGACDISRVMRLPGTLNPKYKPPRPCKVIELHTDRRCALTKIEEVLEMKARKHKRRSKQNATEAMSETIPEGQRNSALTQFVGKQLSEGVQGTKLFVDAVKWNRQYNKPPLSKKEVLAVVRSIVKCEQQNRDSERRLSDSPSTAEFGDIILKDNQFAQDAGRRLYEFRDGCYQAGGDDHIRRCHLDLLQKESKAAKWSGHKSEEIVKYLRLRAPALWERPPLDVVNVANGLLNIDSGKLLPHSPNHLSPIQIPVRYDSHATCPAWDKFVAEVFPADAQDLAWGIVGYLMVPATSIQKAILLFGEGGNGKSTFLEALTAFIGRSNASHVALQDLDGNQFAAAGLVAKLANICADLPKKTLGETATFKAITGGDTIQAERKFKDSFSFVPYSRLVFSANHLPKSDDQSQGFFDRWLVVPFDRGFRGTGGEIPRDVLDKRLADPKELSGVLNKALPALMRLRKTGRFTESKSMRTEMNRLKAKSDPVGVWVEENVEVCAQGTSTASDMLNQYENGGAKIDHRAAILSRVRAAQN